MSDRESFLRAICENPSDDVSRLVYADWLEEQGRHERAFWIRNPERDMSVVERFRLRPLLIMLDAADLAEMAPWEAWCAIRHGFIQSVELRSEAFLLDNFASRLFREHPVTSVTLVDRRPHVYFRAGARRAMWRATLNSFPYPSAAHLPAPLFRFIGQRTFAYRGHALAALDRACVSLGRLLAGLPSLPSGQPSAAS